MISLRVFTGFILLAGTLELAAQATPSVEQPTPVTVVMTSSPPAPQPTPMTAPATMTAPVTSPVSAATAPAPGDEARAGQAEGTAASGEAPAGSSRTTTVVIGLIVLLLLIVLVVLGTKKQDG